MTVDVLAFESGGMTPFDASTAWVTSPGVKDYSAVSPPILATSGYDYNNELCPQGHGGYIDGVVKRAGTYSWHHFLNYYHSGDHVGTPAGGTGLHPSVYYHPVKQYWRPTVTDWMDADTGAQYTFGFSFRLPAPSDALPWAVPSGWGDFYQFHTGNPDKFNGSIIRFSLRGTSAVPILMLFNHGGRGTYRTSDGYCLKPSASEHVILAAVTLGGWYDIKFRLKVGTNGASRTAGDGSTITGDPAGQTGGIEVWYRFEGATSWTLAYSNTNMPTTTFAKSGAGAYTTDSSGKTFCRLKMTLGLYKSWNGAPGTTHHFWLDNIVKSTTTGATGLAEIDAWFTANVDAGGGGDPDPPPGGGVGLPTADYLGSVATSVAGAGFSGMTVNQKRFNKFTLASDTVEVTSIGAYLRGTSSGTNMLKFLLYADSAGAPGALLAQTSEITVSGTDAAEARTAPVLVPVELVPGDYWIGTITGPGSTSGTRAQVDTVTTTGTFKSNADTYSDGPADPAGTMTTTVADLVMTIYVNYSVVSGDVTAPAIVTVETRGTTGTLFYDEPLDAASVSATSAFSRSINGGAAASPTAVSLLVDTVILTFAAEAVQGDVVTYSYTQPGSNKLRDAAPTPNNAASFSGRASTNLSGPRAPASTGRITSPGVNRDTSLLRTVVAVRSGSGGGGI